MRRVEKKTFPVFKENNECHNNVKVENKKVRERIKLIYKKKL